MARLQDLLGSGWTIEDIKEAASMCDQCSYGKMIGCMSDCGYLENCENGSRLSRDEASLALSHREVQA
ncbi:MAG: hypothetical protein KKB70_08555 [Proteobacteria bacterium]|nr:hypothetical protein [Pseudomonadota bacterium]